MHTTRYERAIAEAARGSPRWCIFHTVPVFQRRLTTFLRKQAYGRPIVEVIFNHGELRKCFVHMDMNVVDELDSIPYDLERLLGKKTVPKAFLCHCSEGS